MRWSIGGSVGTYEDELGHVGGCLVVLRHLVGQAGVRIARHEAVGHLGHLLEERAHFARAKCTVQADTVEIAIDESYTTSERASE